MKIQRIRQKITDDKYMKEEQTKRYEQYFEKKMKGVNSVDKIMFNIKEDMKYFTDKQGGVMKYFGE